MAAQFIPNTNPDLVVLDCQLLPTRSGHEPRTFELPIVAWRVEAGDSHALPICVLEPSRHWAILDRATKQAWRPGLGLWECRSTAVEALFALARAEQDNAAR